MQAIFFHVNIFYMKKLYQSFADLTADKPKLLDNVTFVCERCKKESHMLYRVLKKKQHLYCRHCSTELTNLQRYGTLSATSNKIVQEKKKTTCLKKYGVENPFQADCIKEKIKKTTLEKYGVTNASKSNIVKSKISASFKQTCLERYGVESYMQTEEGKVNWERKFFEQHGVKNPQQLKSVQEKTKQTCLERYGVDNYAKTTECRKANSDRWKSYTPEQRLELAKKRYHRYFFDNEYFDSKPELAFYIDMKDAGHKIDRAAASFSYDADGKSFVYEPDFQVDGSLIELKGGQFLKEDGTWQNPFDHSQDERYEAKHQCAVANNVRIVYDYGEYVDDVNEKYSPDFMDLFDLQQPFPYKNEDFADKSDSGIMYHFHKSIYEASKAGKPSPIDGWNNKELVYKVALNRLQEIGHCEPAAIRRGMSITRLAPTVSIFTPSLAKKLINKYLQDCKTIVDPFSGFSGRLLGAVACGKSYAGKDLNAKHVQESNEIIKYKNAQNCSVFVEDILKKENIESFDALFTCPPYSNKENWNGTKDISKSCDEWIDICMQKYKCKKYLFVVDETEKYKDNIVETVGKRNSMFKSKGESIILIKN